MKKEILTATVSILISMSLMACSNENKSMYEIKEQPKVQEKQIQQGYGNVEAQVDPDADKDKALGTKHVVIVDGIPYAELDGAERPEDNYTVSAGNTEDNTVNNTNSAIDKIKKANSDITSSSTEESSTEETTGSLDDLVGTTEDTTADTTGVLDKFIEIAQVNSLEEGHTSGEKVRDFASKYGINIDKNDKVQEISIAVDSTNIEIYALATYKSQEDLSLGLTVNKRTLNLNKNIEVIENSDSRYCVKINGEDGKSSIFDIVAVSYNNEYYLVEAIYLSDNNSAPKTFDNIQEELKL